MIDYSGFRKYLNNHYKGRIPSNIISRLTRLEILLKCDLDKEWEKDELVSVLKRVNNSSQLRSLLNLPPTSHQELVYRHSLNRYIEYKNSLD